MAMRSGIWRTDIPSREGLITIYLGDIPPFPNSARAIDQKRVYSIPVSDFPSDAERDGVTLRSYALAWISLLGDSPIRDVKPAETILRFAKCISTNFQATLTLYSVLYADIISNDVRAPDGSISRPYLKPMEKTPVFREYLHFYKTGCSRSLKYVLSFLAFCKKMQLVSNVEDLESKAFRSWQEIEVKMSEITLSDMLVSNLRWTMNMAFSKYWSPDAFWPKFGPGYVSERGIGKDRADKCEHFQLTQVLDYAFFSNGIYSPSFHHDFPPLPKGERSIAKSSPVCSRLKFVPKTWKSVRSICMEPSAYQWAQQGVALWFREAIKNGPMSNHVYLKDQRFNQRGSLAGSVTGTCDTLDLSSASDSVMWSLVKSTFDIRVLRFLHATRTRYVEVPSGAIIEIDKYAPMGSALCFPVQCTIYTAIMLMVAIAQDYGRDVFTESLTDLDFDVAYAHCIREPLSMSMEDSRFFSPLAYGDDLICDSRTTGLTVRVLESLGFVVNKEKSFRGNVPFRESCGEFHYNGSSVTPFMLKIKDSGPRLTAKAVSSLVDAANHAYEFGYFHLRKFLINLSLHLQIDMGQTVNGLNPIPFTNNRNASFAFFTDRPVDNSHLKSRYDTSTQKRLYKVLTVGPVGKRSSSIDDDYRHSQHWRDVLTVGDRLNYYSEPVSEYDFITTGSRWGWNPI